MFSTRWQTVAAEPFGTIRREMDQALQDLFPQHGSSKAGFRPAMTIRETEAALLVEVDVPGFQQDDLDVQFHDGLLTLVGERRLPEDAGRYWLNERGFGRFERHVRLSDKVDASSMTAELNNGVLTLRIAKKPEAQPVKIAVKASAVSTPETQPTESPNLPE